MTVKPRPFWLALLNWLAFLSLSLAGLFSLYLLRSPERLALLGLPGLVPIGVLGAWRWSWLGLQMLRSRLYLHWLFPRWRQRAKTVPTSQLPPLCFLVPTYKEQLWITERVFRAIAQEAQSLPQPITLLVTSSSEAENAAILSILKAADPELRSIRLIQLVQTGEGKRKAMADGLRVLAQLQLPPETIVALMDGDSELTPGTLSHSLPFFCLFPKVGALTTDESSLVKGSQFFSEWFALHFAKRHYHMCSLSFSMKIMCLTGRFSLIRGEAALHPTFADQIESDGIDDWLWGHYKFLSGDDKSTWYWLVQRGYDMIYVPDVMVYAHETISGALVSRMYQNMRRWYGNMLRNTTRAVALGPEKTGWFMWWCLLDQQFSFWFPLLTPAVWLLSLVQGKWLALGLISAWILATRPLLIMLFFWQRKAHLKLIHLPIFLLFQWSASLVKVWTQLNLAQQKWTNRGNQSISAAGSGWVRWAKLGTSRFLFVSELFTFVIVLLCSANLFDPAQAVAELWWERHAATATMLSQSSQQRLAAIDYGVIPSDGQDDAKALQALINQLPNQGATQIDLPSGEIDLFYPLTISRSETTLQGAGVERTILQAHVTQVNAPAVLTVTSKKDAFTTRKASLSPQALTSQPVKTIVHAVQLTGFTLRQILPPIASPSQNRVSSILLEDTDQIALKYLHLERMHGHPLARHHDQGTVIEYVSLDDDFS